MTIKKVKGGYATVHAHAKKKGSKTDKPKGSIIAKFPTKKQAIAQHRAIAISMNKNKKKR